MRTFVALAVRRRVSVLMAALAIAAFGLVGFDRLSLDLLPDISYPSLTVQTEFPDTAPAEVENLATRPVEKAVGVLRGLQSIHSVSRSGVSEVTLEFDWGTSMEMISMEVREKLDRLVLPDETEAPIVLRFDPSFDPILRIALSGPGDLTEMRRIADRRLKQEFETVKGVAAAVVKGGLEREVQIDVDQERLAALGIPIERIRQVVGVSNINMPGGLLQDEDQQFLVRMVNEFETVEEIGDLIVFQSGAGGSGAGGFGTNPPGSAGSSSATGSGSSGAASQGARSGGIVRLRDVADVRWGTKEREEISRLDGEECIEIAVHKEGDSNTVRVARSVREEVARLKASLPEGYRMTVLFDQSRFIEKAISEVRNAAIVGGILAILVLLAFLRDLRSTLVIATSIPLSIVATFIGMYQLDVTLNIMSLGGLTLAIGMLVDNSIVVLESIFRKRRDGLPLSSAAVSGTSEVGAAVMASTLTTVAVFLPIVFVEGIAGQLFGDMALTVTFGLVASLIIAITLIPMLSAIGRDRKSGAEVAGSTSATPPMPEQTSPPTTLGKASAIYGRLLEAALRRRWATLGTAFLAFILSLFALSRLGTEFIPSVDEGEFFFEVNMPEGTPLSGTDRIIQRMEQTAESEPEIERCYSTIGSRLVAGGLSLNTKAENLGQVHFVMKDRADEVAQDRMIGKLRTQFENIPDLEAKSGKPAYFSLKTPVELVLYGDNLEDLRAYSLTLQEAMADIAGLVDVRSSLEAGTPELQVRFDRVRLAALGLDMRAISETLRDRVHGAVPTRFKVEDEQLDIRIRNQEEDRATIRDVRNLVLPGPDGQPMRLLTVADVREEIGPAEIHRLQQQRAAVLSANLQGRSLGAVVSDIETTLLEQGPPPGVSIEIAGQNREMQVSFQSLRFAIGLAIFLVYLVMAATFESLLHPFIVLFTIPLALVGVAAGLALTGTVISVIVLIGTVMLVGIVVNNAIVLIDTINQQRRLGLEKRDAVVRAGHMRLRPILMTTLTTVLGLLPMALALGEGAELRSPLAITVSSGLLLSTFLTLVVIPAVYMTVPSKVRVEVPDETR